MSDSKEPGVAFVTSNVAASNDNNVGPIKPTPAALPPKPLISDDEFEEQADDLERVRDALHKLIFLLIPTSPRRTTPLPSRTPPNIRGRHFHQTRNYLLQELCQTRTIQGQSHPIADR